MSGTFQRGDILLVAPVALNLVRTGDIIAFCKLEKNDSVRLVAHRVVSRKDAMLFTRGDAVATLAPEVVCEDNLVGRVELVQRGDRSISIKGGISGWFLSSGSRFLRCFLKKAGDLVTPLQVRDIVRYLWRPRIIQIHFKTSRSEEVIKYLHGRRTVALWWTKSGDFWCRKPYDIIIDRPEECPCGGLPSNRQKEW